jgi:pyruvate formate lyase activating enzyme
MQKQALFYTSEENGWVRCGLCPQSCRIAPGKSGICKVRKNAEGQLIAENFGKLVAMNVDPIEKKPLYHFYPGRPVLSIGSAGCNLHCSFCQNHDISQVSIQELRSNEYVSDDIVQKALQIANNIGIAYTYNEPTVFFEFMHETALACRNAGMKNLVISNGFINTEPLNILTDMIDAFNIDLKFFSEDTYARIAGGSLEPVLNSLKQIRASGKHLEITHLLVTGLNDRESEFKEMVDWIAGELGENTMLHISRYFPRHRYSSPPTPESKLIDFYELASEKLRYVYLGNISTPGTSDTYCPSCHKSVIRREGYKVDASGIDDHNACKYCGMHISLN